VKREDAVRSGQEAWNAMKKQYFSVKHEDAVRPGQEAWNAMKKQTFL
jgi:hypothetical protein